ncbi:uncharacterized protein LOC132624250 [Lycium barbarum]|uniref:uncharacterized protein LOC132624250 n=1 Tax=Lycium barbarum TaxID=112863 RepID=UPI00293EA597|nr:uncharacterized protein LOC132624250 [Lycium barbarum]
MVGAFFCGQELPRCITHTNLLLIQKKENINTFDDLRPISLSSFSNKIISSVLHERIVPLLPAIISTTQTSFVKGRSIMENVLLAQEIIRDINKLTTQCGDMVWRLVSNNWYSVLINGQSHGFFKSSRGLKKGDPLSPTLFIIATEVLARNLNDLHDDPAFKGYAMPNFFEKDDEGGRNYEKVSGQLVNNEKSSFCLHEKVPATVVGRVKMKTEMRKGTFPFTYLGYPVFYGTRKIVYYEDSASLSVTFNESIEGVIEQLHKIFAKLFWSNTTGVKGKHWVAWEKMCLPKEEGGLAFRSLYDISKALFAKL